MPRVRMSAGDWERLRGASSSGPSRPREARARKARARGPTEKQVQAAVKGYLESQGAFVVRVNSGAFRNGKGGVFRFNSQRGCSDLLGVLAGGTAFAIEVKRPGHKTAAKRAAEQKAFLAEFARRGAVAGVVESVEDVVKLLEGR